MRGPRSVSRAGARAARAFRPGLEPAESRLLLNGARTFQPDDVLVSLADRVLWLDSSGQPVQSPVLVTAGVLGTGPGKNTGMAFDATGNLYVTRFDAGEVVRFGPTGQFLGVFGQRGDGTNPLASQAPESIAVDSLDRVYVGTANPAGTKDVYVFNSAGLLIAQLDVPTTRAGSDNIALSLDGKTLLYTSQDSSILKYDLETSQSLAPLTTSLPYERAFTVVTLGDGSTLVANRAPTGSIPMTGAIHRLSSAGDIVRSYDVGSIDDDNQWYGAAVTADGASFWAGDDGEGNQKGRLVRFDLASGSVLADWNLGERVHAVLAGPAQATQPPPPTPADLELDLSGPDAGIRPGVPLSYKLTVSNRGPGRATEVLIKHRLPEGLAFVSTSLGGFDAASRSILASLGELDSGASTAFTVIATPQAAGSLILSAEGRHTGVDDLPGNNQDSLSILVVDPPPPPPPALQVLELRRVGTTFRTTQLVLTFDGALDPATARKLSLYGVVPVAAQVTGRPLRRVPPPPRPLTVISARYDAAKRTVTLRLRQAMSMSKLYRVTVADGVRSASGQPLDGDRDGNPGGQYTVQIKGLTPAR